MTAFGLRQEACGVSGSGATFVLGKKEGNWRFVKKSIWIS